MSKKPPVLFELMAAPKMLMYTYSQMLSFFVGMSYLKSISLNHAGRKVRRIDMDYVSDNVNDVIVL